MFGKLIWIALVVIFTLPQELPKFWGREAAEAVETLPPPAKVADAFACPDPMAMFSYFNHGLSDETADCSAILFSEVESKQSFGKYPMTYFDWVSVDAGLAGPPEVEIFTGQYRGFELFVIVDYVDEHILEEPPGLRSSVAYTLWGDAPLNT